MSDAIIVALITGTISLIGILLTAYSNQKKMSKEFDQQNMKFQQQSEQADMRLDAKLEKNLAVMSTRLELLTEEVRKHNNFAQKLPVMDQRITELERRVNVLEKKGAQSS